MADEKKTYPQMPVKHWWTIREKFKSSIPANVTDSYLASILNMEKVSAQTNILPTLKQIGLIEEDGKTTELAKKWRDDQDYPNVCKNIINKIYPQELLDAFSDPVSEREKVYRWFSLHTGNGDTAVNKMLAFYFLLVEADPTKKSESKQKTSKTSTPKAKAETKKPKTMPKGNTIENEKGSSINNLLNTSNKKDIVINVNIQLTVPETTDEKVYQKFFEAMKQHLLS